MAGPDTSHDTSHDATHETAEALDSLLRGEISAVETYVQAIDGFEGEPEQGALRRLRDDHVDSANRLRRHVATRGEDNSTSSGAWGAFARAVEGTAKLLGRTSALQALREGEVHGLEAYERLLMRDDLDASARALVVSELLPRQRRHVEELERLLAVHSAAKKRA
jgi:hypothetical protein